jgi:hypothetical protein
MIEFEAMPGEKALSIFNTDGRLVFQTGWDSGQSGRKED